jgi:hypothetical protein
LDLSAASDKATLASYRKALGSLANAPFAYETAQAVWLVMGALLQAAPNPATAQEAALATPAAREAVWRNLARTPVPTLAGSEMLSNKLAEIYVYQITPPNSQTSTKWHSTLVHVARLEARKETP